ncbi:Putative zinc-finger [Hathewaya proteolytica DSM 3090]|uniref:Anti-sigma-W factor RsiW n=1 Tax=Hathewaya proteolytica DSM 3090 TaxID=1121331 RepID=A0A1M6LQH4_9CLOT|nr:zf-HC2 domain-containing protein [Hathewaya proteolytica]SHJ73410.1 Putative zinc-finger [Hathewaya proteolytica DSM 3090]
MSNKCNLIKDILPLYVEDMVSAETREFVSDHLEHCEECHEEFEHMRKTTEFIPDTDIAPLKRIKKELFIKLLQTIFFTVTLVCSIVVVVFGVLTTPKFFPYSNSLLDIIDNHKGKIIIGFDDKVTGYSCIKEFNSETETEVYRINAWTTTWDLYSSNHGKQNMVIPFSSENKIQIFYAQNDGSEDVLIYGVNENAGENTVTLPRLILMPYFILAFLAFVVLAMARFLLKNKSVIIVWIDRTILFPISYMAAHLCIKGIDFTTYSSQRDFCIIMLVAIVFYFAMLTGEILYKAKRRNPKK